MGSKVEESMDAKRICTGILIIFSGFILTGMARRISIDHTKEPFYEAVAGKKFQTATDLVIFQYSDTKNHVQRKRQEVKYSYQTNFYLVNTYRH